MVKVKSFPYYLCMKNDILCMVFGFNRIAIKNYRDFIPIVFYCNSW